MNGKKAESIKIVIHLESSEEESVITQCTQCGTDIWVPREILKTVIFFPHTMFYCPKCGEADSADEDATHI